MAGPLSVRRRHTLELPELSGLGERAGPGGRQLVAVSDQRPVLALAELAADGRLGSQTALGVGLGRAGGQRADQGWEAACGDASGRLFLLREDPGEITLLGPDLSQIEGTIRLSVPAQSPEFESWDEEPNSRGEGLVLLANGHLLIAKEKRPARLMEFGPPGEAPGGISSHLVVGLDGRFPAPSAEVNEFGLLASWPLAEPAAERFADLADAAVAPGGRIWLLSEDSRCLGELRLPLEVGQAAEIGPVLELPGEVRGRPEGLLVLADGTALVGTERRPGVPNVYRVGPLDR